MRIAVEATMYNVKCTHANTEFTMNLPRGTKKFMVKCNDEASSGDVIDDIRYAFRTGGVATNGAGPHGVIAGGTAYYEDGLYFQSSLPIYFATPVSNVNISVTAWK